MWEAAVNSAEKVRGVGMEYQDKRINLPGIVDDLGDETCPSALVGRSQSTSGVSIEELVEPHVVLPVLVEIEEI